MNNFFLILLKNPARLLQALKKRLGLLHNYPFKACITPAEITCLQKYAKSAKEGIVEIGVLDGGTTREMALVANVPIYGLDPLVPDSMDNSLQGQIENIKNNLKFYQKFTFIKDYSYNLAPSWNKKIDFIFIDGDHRYEAVKKDYEDWLPLLSTNGIMAFHDSANNGYEGPTKLVEELMSDRRVKYLETSDSISVFRKV
ncbi:MAG: Group 1 glycosyl transferase [Candidatus Magasanikbacteria bacterium GW2011_GWC2_37_14]|uniref:Group 1 glycosyl transferase n=1 Tax=Candidatus Magasanikbacteria bacterium GW2011_GWC2_37_14 TaxID=1619046 RepID=A0A0G0JGG0_9BACT|nr:MAG: Group 1 glycosyl transferase [Candidatus Magasanikbacteria bacterium GW2011_GWC2_37_14]